MHSLEMIHPRLIPAARAAGIAARLHPSGSSRFSRRLPFTFESVRSGRPVRVGGWA